MKYSEIPGDKGDSPPDPDALVLFVSNRGQSCVDPEHRTSECVAPRDQVAILVPVAQQATGTFVLEAKLQVPESQSLHFVPFPSVLRIGAYGG